MEPATTTVAVTALGSLVSWVASLGLGGQLVTGPVGNWAHQALEAARLKGWQAVTSHFARGRLPPNHHVARVCRTAMSEALVWMASELRQAGPQDMRADLLRALDASAGGEAIPRMAYQLPPEQQRWVDALSRLARDEVALQQLDEADSSSQDVQRMLQWHTDEAAATDLHRRIRTWLDLHLQGKGEPPESLQCFLDQGWPMAQHAGRLTLYQAWCWHFRERLKDQQEVFNSFVGSALADLLQGQRQTQALLEQPQLQVNYAEDIGRLIDDRFAQLLHITQTVDTRTRAIAASTERTEQLAQRADASLLQLTDELARGSSQLESVHQLLERVFRIVSGPATPHLASSAGLAEGFPVFVGLRAYRRKDALHFFGRETEIEAYLALIAAPGQQTLLLKGRSGVGKSSIMLAGVLPRLPGRRGSKVRNYLYMAPGTDPFLELLKAINSRASSNDQRSENALKREADRLSQRGADLVRLIEREIDSSAKRVLYIDQLEELLIDSSIGEAAAQASFARKQAFLQVLLEFLEHDRQRNFVVATLREDYAERKSDASTWVMLTRLFEAGPVRSVRMPDHDAIIDRMVQGPCELVGFGVDPQLLAALRIDVRRVQGWPPLLSACLEEMVRELQQRSVAGPIERRLTLAHYQSLGGLQDIVARRARFIEDALSFDDLQALPELFRRLVRIDQTRGLPTKDRLPLGGIPAELGSLVDCLLRERLLSDEGAVELIHDALFDSWPALTRWISSNRERLLDREDFQSRVQCWLELGRPERKLAREDDLSNNFGVLRDGLRDAIQREPKVQGWVMASRQAELYKHLGAAAANPEVWRLPRLIQEGVRLTPQQIDSLEQRDRCFYYAMCPDALTPRAPSLPGVASGSVSADFSSQAGGETDPLDYFKKEDLELETGRDTRYRLHHFAALGGNVAVLKRLQDLGMDLDAVSSHGRTAVDMVCIGGHVEALRYLLEQAADPAAQVMLRAADSGRNAIHSAASFGHPDLLALLLDVVPSTVPIDTADEKGWTPLAMAVFFNYRAVVECLLDSGRANSAAGAPVGGLVGLAVAQGHVELAQMLLTRLPAADLLLDNSLSADSHWPPLAALIVAWRWSADLAQRIAVESLFAQLIERGANVEARVTDRQWPLVTLAACNGAVSLMLRLMESGADPWAPDPQGWTALDWAIGRSEESAAMLLLERPDWPALAAGADAAQGPLRAAARAGLHDVAQRILDILPAGVARHLIDASFCVSVLDEEADARRRMECGRVIDLLQRAGVLAPLQSEWVRDGAGRIEGVALRRFALDNQGTDAGAWHWPYAPILDGTWLPMAAPAAQAMIDGLDAQHAVSKAEWESWRLRAVRSLALPWYLAGMLVELSVESRSGQAGRMILLRAGSEWRRLIGNSPVLHELNARWLQPMDTALALDYLDFFCALVHGEHGPFRLLRRADRVTWSPTATETQRARVRALWQAPEQIKGKPGDKSHDFSCQILYANALFKAHMRVQPGGMCEMISDLPLDSELDTWEERFVDRVLQLLPRQPT